MSASERIETASRVVLIAGASSASGAAVAAALDARGARTIAVGSNRERLDPLVDRFPSLTPFECDLTDARATDTLAANVRDEFGRLDGVIHLVGGWRGGGGIAGQSDEDWAFLSRSLTSLRNVSRAFYDDLLASDAGRLAIISSTSVDTPTAGGANYAALKAASETWVKALAQGFAKAGDTAAAVIFVVKTLVGLEAELADRVVGLWASDAATMNGARLPLA